MTWRRHIAVSLLVALAMLLGLAVAIGILGVQVPSGPPTDDPFIAVTP